MTRRFTASVRNKTYEDLETYRKAHKITRSEVIEEFLRKGLESNKKGVGSDAEKDMD